MEIYIAGFPPIVKGHLFGHPTGCCIRPDFTSHRPRAKGNRASAQLPGALGRFLVSGSVKMAWRDSHHTWRRIYMRILQVQFSLCCRQALQKQSGLHGEESVLRGRTGHLWKAYHATSRYSVWEKRVCRRHLRKRRWQRCSWHPGWWQ
jgi:hypothetical protein